MTKTSGPFLIPIVTILAMFGPFSVDTYLPAFPEMESEYGVSTAAMSQTLGIFLFAFAFSTLAWGPLIDRYGRKSMVLVSLLGFALASVGCALATDFTTFAIFRGVQGLFASCGLIAGRAMIRDVYEGSDAVKAMSTVMFLFAAAPALAPIIGAWLLDLWGWESIFWFLTLLALGLALATLFLISETQSPDHVQSIHPVSVTLSYIQGLTNLRFVILLLSMSFSFGGMFIYIAGASQLIYGFLQLGGHDFSLLFVPMVIGMMLGSWLARKMSAGHSARVTVSRGFGILVVAVVFNVSQAALMPTTPFFAIAPLTLYAVGISLLMPSIGVMVLDSFPTKRGMASALQGFLYMGSNALVASVLIPFILAQLLWFTLAQGAMMVIGLVLWWLYLLMSAPISKAEAVAGGER